MRTAYDDTAPLAISRSTCTARLNDIDPQAWLSDTSSAGSRKRRRPGSMNSCPGTGCQRRRESKLIGGAIDYHSGGLTDTSERLN